MNADISTPQAEGFREEDLLQLEICIAQRADELWKGSGSRGGTDLIHWMRAEREVLSRFLGFERVAAAMLAGQH